MTDYNDGKWHGWNGGDCPVHPQSEIEVVFTNTYGDTKKGTRRAGIHIWGNPGTHAFRVVKAYREPRDFWVNEYPTTAAAHESKEIADKYASSNRIACIHVREVLE